MFCDSFKIEYNEMDFGMRFDQYDDEVRRRYEALAEEIKSKLHTTIAEKGRYHLQHIQCRAKTRQSVEGKLIKQGKLDAPDIRVFCKDLAGCRVIFYNNFDVEKFGYDLVIPELYNVDIDRTKFHEHEFDETNAKKMFESYNFVVSLKPDHSKYDDFADEVCEIQVQTALNHTWSEMAHDIIYKPPLCRTNVATNSNHKADLQRFAHLKNEFIAPAGRILQSLVNDQESDKKGQERFDREVLRQLKLAETNNERFKILNKLNEETIPKFHDIEPEITAIRYQLEETWRKADEKSESDCQNNRTGDRESHEVTQLIADIFKEFWKYGPDTTYSIAVRLYVSTKCEESRQQLICLAEYISKNSKDVWEKHGPLVQLIIARKLENEPRLIEAGEIVCVFATEILNPEVTGATCHDEVITAHRGSVIYSKELWAARKVAIDCLFEIVEQSDDLRLIRMALDCLLCVAKLPVIENFPDKLAESIIKQSIEVLGRLKNKLPTDDFDYIQKFEVKLYRVWLPIKRLHRQRSENKELASLIENFSATVQGIVCELNSDSEFVIFKVLTVSTPYFKPHWEIDIALLDDGPGVASEITHDYRAHKIERFCKEIDNENYAIWKDRIVNLFTCGSLRPSYTRPIETFLRLVAEEHVNFVFELLLAREELPDWSVHPLALILVKTTLKNETFSLLFRWLRDRKYVTEITDIFSDLKELSTNAMLACVEGATEGGDIEALSSLARMATENYGSNPEFWREKVFVPVVWELIRLGCNKWIDSTWFVSGKPSIYSALSEKQKDHLIDIFAGMTTNDDHVDRIMVSLSSGSPIPILHWIEKRLERSETCSDDSYKAFPTSFIYYRNVLQKHPGDVISAVRRWSARFDLTKHWTINEFLKSVFLECYEVLEPVLLEQIEEGDTDTLLFLSTALQGFGGDTKLLRVLRAIIASPRCNDEIRARVLRILSEEDGMRGRYGKAETFERKVKEISSWLEDQNEQVAEFAKQTTEKFRQKAHTVRRDH